MPDTDPLGIDWTRRNSFLLLHLDVLGFTLPKTSSSQLPGGRNPKGNYIVFQLIRFQVLC